VSAHIKWFAILLILAAPVTVCASDESDVKDAAKSFATGLAKGDADQTKQYATSDANTVAIIDGLAPIVAASHRLHDAAVDKFGKDGERLAQNPGGNMSEWSKRADQSAARITGDTATLSAREDPADKSQASSQSQPQPLHLKKEGGKWKVDLAGTPKAKAMDETAGEVKDGKYQNVNQAQAALRQKVAAAVVDSRGGVPSGSYRGRGSNGSGGAGGRGPNQ
jgi:hypothetical protein